MKKTMVGVALSAILLLSACTGSKEVTKSKEFLDAGMFDQAIILLKQEVQTNPKNAEAHMLLGAAYLGNGMTALAEQELNTATVLDEGIKQEASKRCYEVAKYLAKTNKAQSHTALIKAKEYDPSLEKDEHFFFLANIDTEDSESYRTDAAKRYLTLFPSGPSTAQATYTLAEGLMSSGDRDQAKVYFNQLASQFASTEWGKKAGDQLANWVAEYNIQLNTTLQDFDTKIQVKKGQTITILGTGRINGSSNPSDGAYKWVGPDGWGSDPTFNQGRTGPLQRGQSFMALCVRIGTGKLPVNDGRWRLAGSNFQFTADQDGTAHLTVNDVNDPTGMGDWWSDNQGELAVKIQIK
ncbi:MAG TPA: tetratricopeptide repeat protein [Pyrinomonadaceae bacterium]|nr:tetratricopeptide repeat protein [Pyrinomonadaceae bacterium]